MADQFSDTEWNQINALIDQSDATVARQKARADKTLAAFGLPERRAQSLVFGSWNIRKFGNANGHSDAARAFYARFAARCDLLAIQEVMTDMFSLRDLRDRMAAAVPGANYRILASDVTGRGLDGRGLAERLAFIYDANRIRHTDIASDISFDRSAIIKNVNAALDDLRQTITQMTGDDPRGFFDRAMGWAGFNSEKMTAFFDFIRAPHFATFEVLGDEANYEVAIANAHLHFGKKKQREKEFLTLLHWIFQRAKMQADAPITMILGDLNLDFKSNNEQRRGAIESFLSDINKSGSQMVDVNFPFLYDHPVQGLINTNARQSQTFDHIAYFHRDGRLPLAQHNQLAGSSTEDFFDYGMFNFVELFKAAGVIGETINKNGQAIPDYTKFEHDVSDHMPIWARIPVPQKNQWTFDQLSTDAFGVQSMG